MTLPNAIVMTTAGINCEGELAEAFSLAGARVEYRHLNELMADPALLDQADLIGLPGGFSYGDAIAAGRITAQLLRRTLFETFRRAIERRVPIIAPCNGFQVVAQVGLVPGGEASTTVPPRPTVTLADNERARFVDRWSRIEVPSNTRCIWTQGLELDGETATLPVAHGEGRFIPSSDAVLAQLEAQGQIALRYAPDDNPNGSFGNVAGICDSTGLVFGLMPHPERYVRWTQHPYWTRLDEREVEPPGLQMFRNAVRYAQSVREESAAGTGCSV